MATVSKYFDIFSYLSAQTFWDLGKVVNRMWNNSTNGFSIGRMILTKKPWIFDPNGDKDREEVTDQYKAREGKYMRYKYKKKWNYITLKPKWK